MRPNRARGLTALAAGAAAALGQAPFGVPLVALPALAVLFLVTAGVGGRAGLRLGWLAGVGYFAVALHWIVEPFLVDVARHGWMAPFALIFLAGGLALFWAVPVGLAARVGGGRHVLALAAALTLGEAARAWVLTGFPWALVAYMWVDTPLMQLAAVAGPHGLGLGTFLLAGLIAAAWHRPTLLLVPVLVLAAGWTVLSPPDDPPVMTETTVRLVQPNAPQHLKWQPDMLQVFFDRQLAATRAPGTPDLVVWPEAAVPYLAYERPDLDATIAAAAGPDAHVFLGLRHRETDGAGGQRWLNAATLLDPDGAVVARYDKHHLVPFGEYLPFPAVWDRLGLTALAANAGRFGAGPGPAVIAAPGLPAFQPLICYEAIFPAEILRGADRPDWLLHITNDAWFGTFSGPYQHLAQAQMRAVEQGLPLARSANTGVSAMIDPRGRILARLDLGTAGYLDARLPAPLPATVYSRTGDPPWLLAAGLVLLAGLVRTARR